MRTLRTLRDDADLGLTHIEIRCTRCSRAGRYRLDRLIEKHGADMPIRAALADINADCPQREAAQLRERCDLVRG